MRRYLYIYVVLLLVTAPVYGQDTQDEQPKAQSTVTAIPDEERTAPSTATEQTPNPNPDDSPTPVRPTRSAAPPAYRYRPTQKRPPAAQYSPLAAQGGYWRPQTSPWQMIVDYFNPHHLNMGQFFAERKQNWLDNVAYNEYFWYSFWVTFLLIMSWFVIAWIHEDRHRETWELAECASDALRHSEYCKREAKEAIRRHNDHIDKCNRIVEDRRSGRMTTPGTADLEGLNEQIKSLTSDKQANEFQISRPWRCHQTGPAVLDDAVAFLDVVIMPADRFFRFALAVFGISERIGCAFGQFPGCTVTVVVNPRDRKPTED